MSSTTDSIIPYDPIAMKLSHSNDSIVTAVDDDDDMIIPRFLLGAEYPQTSINQPDLSSIGKYLDDLFKKHYSRLLRKGKGKGEGKGEGVRKMTIVGIIGSNDRGCHAYGKSLESACISLGVEFEVFDTIGEGFEDAKALIAQINARGDVDGMIVFTPIFGGERVSLHLQHHLFHSLFHFHFSFFCFMFLVLFETFDVSTLRY